MNDLIAQVLSGEAGEFERRRLDEWRRASPDNERLYQELAEVWSLSAPAESRAQVPPPPSAADIIAKAERRRALAVPLASRRLRSMRPWGWVAAAAAMLAVGVGLTQRRSAAVREFATGPTQTRTVALSDGSVVRLGPGSQLRIRKVDERRMELRGVAFFAVATDSTHPFVVGTDVGAVQVLGTRFEVRAGADSLRLVVVEGRVRLTGTGGHAEVARGSVGRIVGASRPSVADAGDIRLLLDWPHGLLIFQATPLAEVMDEVGARFGRPFVIRDPELARRTVTAWFEDEPLEAVVNTVCLVVGARCAVGDTVEVGR